MPPGRQGAERGRRLAVLCLLATCLAPALGAGADDKTVSGRMVRVRAERVLDVPLAAAQVATADGRLWAASRGGGLLAFQQGRIDRRFDLGRGLPSAVVHDLAVLGDGRLLAGTDRGLVLVDPRTGDSRPIVPPRGGAREEWAADLVVSADRGASAVFQLSSVTHQMDAEPTASLWRWENDRVQRWDPHLGPGLVATAGFHDPTDRCLHVAGVQSSASARVPWYARDCAGKTSAWRLADGAPAGTIGVAGLARAPQGGRVVLIVVTQSTADPGGRRHVAMEIQEDGKLVAHCSNAAHAEPVTGLVRHGNDLIVARRGIGVETLGCGTPRAVSSDPRLRDVTALASDRHAGLLVATDLAVIQVRGDGSTVVMAQSPDAIVPADTLPMQPNAPGTRVLLSSPADGPLELERARDAWQIARRWRAGHEVPRAVYGPAIYAPDGDVLAVVRSRGVLRLRPGAVATVQIKDGAAPSSPLDVAATARGLWLAAGATPFDQAGAGLHFVAPDGSARFVALPDRQTQPSGRMLTWPDGRVWVGTRIGVIEADPRGTSRRVSAERVDVLHRNEARNVIGAVGATIQQWSGERMVPVMFAIEPRPARPLGHPVDLVVDDEGRWVILYSGGYLVLLDAERRFVTALDAWSGVPPTSRRLAYLPKTDEILIGSAREGLFSLRWPHASP